MANLSQAIKEAYARASSNTRHLVAIALRHTAFPGGVLRYVGYSNDLTINSNIYTAMAMDVQEPEVGSEPDNKAKIRIDGIPGVIQYYVNGAVETATPIYCDVIPFALNTSNDTVIGVIGTYDMQVLKVQYDMQSVSLSLGHISPTNMPFPRVKYDAETYPYLYR